MKQAHTLVHLISARKMSIDRHVATLVATLHSLHCHCLHSLHQSRERLLSTREYRRVSQDIFGLVRATTSHAGLVLAYTAGLDHSRCRLKRHKEWDSHMSGILCLVRTTTCCSSSASHMPGCCEATQRMGQSQQPGIFFFLLASAPPIFARRAR